MDLENSSTEVVQSLDFPMETLEAEPVEAAEPQPAEVVDAETDGEDITLTEDERSALEALRLQEQQELFIAQNPHLRQQYEAQRNGVQALPQAHYLNPQMPPANPAIDPMGQALPFDEATFDPFNPQHQAALMQMQIQPLIGYVQQLQQSEAQAAFQEQVSQADQHLNSLIDKALPGFTEAIKQEGFKSQAFNTLAMGLFKEESSKYSHKTLLNPVVQKAIVSSMVPKLKQAAQELGVGIGRKATVNKTASQEAFVEPASAVPSVNLQDVDKAIASGDDLAAVKHLFFKA